MALIKPLRVKTLARPRTWPRPLAKVTMTKALVDALAKLTLALAKLRQTKTNSWGLGQALG